MRHTALTACLALAWYCLPASGAPATPENKPTPAAVEYFEKHVRPMLVEKCIACHGPQKQRGGLRLDSRKAILEGGDSGPALVAGQPDKSLLLKVVRRDGDVKMPPKETLSPAVVNALSTWVRSEEGAPYPTGSAAPTLSAMAEARKRHWSFRPIQRPSLPGLKDVSGAVTPIDRFWLAKLEGKGLTPSPAADRRTLLRRVTLDLIGLPPTPEEVDAFLVDSRPDAYERLVDRLLASPAYGERWGRHWLDVARYADTRGYVFTSERRFPYSYTYRDYVVRTFNEDLPYDRFILEQLAADQLPLGEDRRALAAMGFLTLGRRFLNNVHDIIDDRIDVVTRGLMGLTVACARCHDHKFDPIPTRDYYSLHGVFASSIEPAELPLIAQRDQTAGAAEFEKEMKKRQAVVDDYLQKSQAELVPAFRARAADYLLATATAPPGRGKRKVGELKGPLLARWRLFLVGARKKHHPVLEPWLAFARLPKEAFAARSDALAKRIVANRDSGRPINPLVAKAFAEPAPTTLADVAQRYGQLFQDADKAWQELLIKTPAATRLPDADREAIRQVLHAPGAPPNVPVAEIDRYLDQSKRNKLAALRKRVLQWQASGPGSPPRAMVLNDASAPVQPRVLVRGNPGNPGVPVPRQFLEILSTEGRKPFTKGSGRLEMAKAIASADNPLTARVMVNRVWQHHFGQGLVRTSGDFGLRGEPPTHPELLDFLAGEFIESGWSVKHLHRRILLSGAYRQSSDENPRAAAVDPENRLLWRMNRQRLEFEPLRDSLLAVAGRLDGQMGGTAVDITKAPYPARRSIYGFIDRQNLPGLFRTFDLASPDTATPQRHTTTVPQQALFLMNGPFVIDQAKAFANRPQVLAQKTDHERIDRMHRLAYGRPADPAEIVLGLKFIQSASISPAQKTGASDEKSGGLSAWEQYAQVLLLANELAFVD